MHISIANPTRCRQTLEFGAPTSSDALHCSVSSHGFVFSPNFCKGGAGVQGVCWQILQLEKWVFLAGCLSETVSSEKRKATSFAYRAEHLSVIG